MSRKLLQQALNALEDAVGLHVRWDDAHAETIAALREALAAPQPEPVAWRPEVVAFATSMEKELLANDWKGGWKDDAPGLLLEHAEQEMRELVAVFLSYPRDTSEYRQALASEAADVANMVMMVADVCGALQPAAPPAAPAPVVRSDAESDYALDERMDEVLPLSAAPVVPKPEYSDEEVERAIITLRGITQEIRGRGIDAVMLLEEQIKSLSAAPVVREPSTYRQIAEATGQWADVPSDKVIGIWRAAEQVHGIGGGNG